MYELLEKLTYAHAVAGDSEEKRSFILEQLDKLGVQHKVDGYGSVIVGDDKNGNKLIIAAHMDEVGFQIVDIHEDGTLSVLPIGWIFPNRLDHTGVYVRGDKGLVYGAIFHKAVLKTENVETFSQMFLDLGVESRAEVEKLGVKVGQTGTFKKDYFETDSTIMASSVDNNVSIFVLLELIKKDPSFLDHTLVVFHTDEEMQDHSANSIGNKYHYDYAVIMDYCPIHQEQDAEDRLPVNDGPILMYRGGAHILHEDVRKKVDNLGFAKGFISDKTLPSLEPQNFQNNGMTKALNYVIPARGYHGQLYSIKKKNIEAFSKGMLKIKEALLK